jgi:hypothetical protein
MYYLARQDVVHPSHVKPLKDAYKMIKARLEEQIQADPATNQMLAGLFAQICNRYPIKVDEKMLELARQKALATVPAESSVGK